jgi:hypothetical protein
MISESCGVGLPILRKYVQVMRDAGMMTPGGRPDWTTADAVNALLAVLTNATPGNVADLVRMVRALPLRPIAPGPPWIARGRIAGVALEELINSMRNGDFEEWRAGREMLISVSVVNFVQSLLIGFTGDAGLIGNCDFQVPGNVEVPFTREIAIHNSVMPSATPRERLLQRLAVALGPIETK